MKKLLFFFFLLPLLAFGQTHYAIYVDSSGHVLIDTKPIPQIAISGDYTNLKNKPAIQSSFYIDSLRNVDTTRRNALINNTLPPTPGQSLGSWFAKAAISPSTLKIAMFGNSTSDLVGNASAIPGLINSYTGYGQPLEGFNVGSNLLNFGQTGNIISGLLNQDITNPKSIPSLIAAAPDLVVFSYGINDIRQNQLTEAQLKADIIIAINRIRAGLPNVSIVLRMPNSFLNNNPGIVYIIQGGYASVAAAAQAQSNILYQAYWELRNQWPNVILLDTQDLIYGRTCQTTSALMTDAIHPIYTPMIALLVQMIGYRQPYSQPLANLAQSVNYAAPYTYYPRAMEDNSHYYKVVQGTLNGAVTNTSTTLDINNSDAYSIPKIYPNDIVNVGDQFFFTGIGNQFVQTATVERISFNAGAVPANTAGIGAVVTIYRPIYNNVQACEQYMKNSIGFPYRRRVKISSGVNFIDLTTPLDDIITHQSALNCSQYTLTATDVLVPDGIAPMTLTGATFAANGNNLRITLTGDWTSLNGKICYVFGNHNYEDNYVRPYVNFGQWVTTIK